MVWKLCRAKTKITRIQIQNRVIVELRFSCIQSGPKVLDPFWLFCSITFGTGVERFPRFAYCAAKPEANALHCVPTPGFEMFQNTDREAAFSRKSKCHHFGTILYDLPTLWLWHLDNVTHTWNGENYRETEVVSQTTGQVATRSSVFGRKITTWRRQDSGLRAKTKTTTVGSIV